MSYPHNNNSTSRRCLPALAALLLALGVTAASAAAPPPAADATPAAGGDTDIPDWLLVKLDPYHRRVTSWVENTARGIDSFLGTTDAWRTDNDSWLRVSEDFTWDQSDRGSNRLRPRLHLDLPTASKRLRLIIENDTTQPRGAGQEALPSQRNAVDTGPTLFGIGLGGFGKWAPQWEKKLQAGVRVRLPLDPYARAIATRRWELGGDWDLNSYNRVAWFQRDGYSANSEITVGEPLAPRWRMQFTTDFSWSENDDYLEFAESVNFAHILNKRSVINYSAGVIGTGFTGPKFNTYFLATHYRRDVHRQLLFVDVIPELTFPRDEGFDPHWAITLRAELYFRREVK